MLMTLVMAVGCLILALVNGWKLTLVMIAFVPLLVITGIIQMKQLTGTNKSVKDAEECGKVILMQIYLPGIVFHLLNISWGSCVCITSIVTNH